MLDGARCSECGADIGYEETHLVQRRDALGAKEPFVVCPDCRRKYK